MGVLRASGDLCVAEQDAFVIERGDPAATEGWLGMNRRRFSGRLAGLPISLDVPGYGLSVQVDGPYRLLAVVSCFRHELTDLFSGGIQSLLGFQIVQDDLLEDRVHHVGHG